MASIEQIIKDLEDIRDSGGAGSTGGGTAASRRTAALQAKEAITNSKEFNKNTKQRLDLEIKALRIAQNQYKLDEKEYKVIGQQIKTREKQIETNEKFNEITKKVGQSFVGLGKAAFEGQGSISAFTDNIKGLGILGNRLDVNIETFRQLSQSGANFGKSIVDLRVAAGEAALPLDDFASLVANNSQNLAALFGSTTQGAKRIAELGRITREVGIERLAPLGLTVDEINETLLLNLDSQRRTGILGRLTDEQRTESAINFAEQLDRLAKLTGQQRDELRSQIEQQKSNERFQAALQGQTDETRQRLQAFAGTVAGISPELAEGFQDLIANAGVPVTESALALVQNIPGARDVINDLISGVVSSEDALVRIRDISAGSVDRFRQATVTGQVEFLRLQGGIIELGRRVTDSGAVFDEQRESATSLVKNLTTFEQATKVLSSQFQGIETALLKSFGPALGGLVGGIQTIFGAGGAVAKALAGAPALTASLIGTALIGKVLFGPAMQILTTAKGVAMGINMSKGGSMFGGMGATMGKALGKGGTGRGGAFGNFARTGIGRGVGAVGLGANALTAFTSLTDDDKTNDASGIGTIAGSVLGGALGLLAGPGGALLGASLGGMAGGAIGGMFGGGKQYGGGMDAGKTYLVGERGPEMITSGTTGTVTANQDLKETFDTTALESKMAAMSTELNNANKSLASMVNGVNTLVAVESRALKAVETTARKDRNQVGLV
tara:strand:- start:63 stop:2243 length:2181 start_codon:yes stop_codon:yes gene_type:complete